MGTVPIYPFFWHLSCLTKLRISKKTASFWQAPCTLQALKTVTLSAEIQGDFAMKVTVFLRNDHEKLKSIIGRYNSTAGRSPKDREGLLSEIEREIMIHSQMENEIFYPALENSASIAAAQLVEIAKADHKSIETLLGEIRSTPLQDRQFSSRVNELFDQVIAHMDREEEELFEEARKTFSEPRLEELGLEMEERRRILGQMAA
jgi:hypothetical protein